MYVMIKVERATGAKSESLVQRVRRAAQMCAQMLYITTHSLGETEVKFLKVGLREKRADLSFPVSPTRGRIRCGTIWLLAWMGIFQNFTFQKVKPNRTQVSSFLYGREIRPYSLVRRSRLADYCSRLLDDSDMRGRAEILHFFSRCHRPLFCNLRHRPSESLSVTRSAKVLCHH